MISGANAAAHNLLRDLMAIDYELESLAILARATREASWGSSEGPAAEDLLDLVEERRNFIMKMQSKLIGAALPSLREHYKRILQHTEESVNIISSRTGQDSNNGRTPQETNR